MDSAQAIMLMIAVCVVFMFYMLLSKQIKTLLKIVVQGFVGLTGIFLCNYLAAPFGITVGLNIVTWIVTGILGIPGGVLLYAVSLALKAA